MREREIKTQREIDRERDRSEIERAREDLSNRWSSSERGREEKWIMCSPPVSKNITVTFIAQECDN